VSIILVFIAAMTVIAVWWLSHQRLASKPWLEVGSLDDIAMPAGPTRPTAKIGLFVFLAVVCAILSLLVSAFFMRIAGDWRPLPEPKLLWVNTGVLVASSLALQWAWISARENRLEALKSGLLLGGASAIAFLAGQILVWRQLHDGGYFVAGNPAVSFFYLLTAVHGIHLAGGMVALGRAGLRLWRGAPIEQLRLSAELCAIYWHFLLVVWVVLFGLLLLTSRFVGIAQSIADFICGGSGG
jgi:cytochrome c oxidase subunit 3